MSDAGKPDLSARLALAILDFKMARLHRYSDAVAVNCEHATFSDGRFAGCGQVR